MLSLYRSTTLVAPLRAGAARSITSSAVMMAKKKEIGEFISGLDGVSSLASGDDGVKSLIEDLMNDSLGGDLVYTTHDAVH